MKKLLFNLVLVFISFSVQSQSYDLLGISSYDGVNGNGFIYHYNNGNLEHIHDFISLDNKGKYPNNKFVSINGVIYGTTVNGGVNNVGTIFSVNPVTAEATNVYNFDRNICAFPRANVVSYNNKIYGYANYTSFTSNGSLFEFDPASGNISVLFTFTDSSTQGGYIYGLTQENGVIYGVTRRGGSNDEGVLFSYDIGSASFNVLHHFVRSTDGQLSSYFQPVISNNVVYGVNTYGGSNGSGTIYKYDLTNNQFQVLYNFESTSISRPRGKVVMINDNIYGICTSGGADHHGGIFKYDTSAGQFTILYTFDSDIYLPSTGIINYNGLLLGVLQNSSLLPDGGIFSFNLNNSNFSTFDLQVDDKFYPFLNFIDNHLFMVEVYGGHNLSGKNSLINMVTQNISNSYSFSVSPNGNEPWGKLSIGSNGKYYGMTRKGGQNGKGIIYEVDNSGNFQKLYDFANTNWYSFLKKITLVGDDIYAVDFNEIIKININTHQVTNIATLSNYTYTPLILASDGNLYGTTYHDLNMFKLNPNTNQLTEYQTSGTASYSTGDLTEYNGKIYGFARRNNQTNKNCIVSFDLTSHSMEIVSDFDNNTGGLRTTQNGQYKLTELNSKLYACTNYSTNGVNFGSLLELEPTTNTITKILDLNYSNYFGQELLPIGNDHLLGTFGDKIVLFDVINHTQQEVITLSPEIYASLTSLINMNTSGIDDKILKNIKIYPNPTTDFVYLKFNDKVEVNSVNLISIKGKTLLKNIKSNKIDLTKYKKGIYLLQIVTSNGNKLTKLIVKK